MVEQTLAGKVALVTGAGRGIGAIIARRLAASGAFVVVHYSGSEAGAAETVAAIQDAGGEAIAYRADLTVRAEVQALFVQLDDAPGRLDILVNCAGISGGGSLADLDDEQLERLIAVNLKGPLYMASEAARRMGEGGRVINFSSSTAKFPVAGSGIYTGVKRAVEGMTESWAKELGKRGITVNTVVPGATEPGMFERTPPEWRKVFEQASPFGRVGQASEIAELVAFLASPAASWVSGSHILANGAANT